MGLAVGTKLGPYEIVSPLGSGGMGEVYCARDTRLERNVAVKVLPANLRSDPSLRQRLEREAKAISKLSHPHICTLHDIGHQDGMDFLVMELLDGETLEQRLRKGPLPPEQTIRYAAQIADALAKAHKQGITHRDLKPSNVMLTKAGTKLMDFGLAKQTGVAPMAEVLTEMTAEQSKLTTEGSIVGTFQYMAPEQLEGKEADARTDIFALGELIYEMATGRSAFNGKSRASLIAAILTTDPPPITQLQPMTPLALDRLVRKCLAKDPDERWQNAADLGSELDWIAESSVSTQGAMAPAQNFRERAWKIAIVSIGCIAIVLGYLYWGRTSHTSQPQVVRSFINAPEKLQFNLAGDVAGPVMVSPDGTQLVFSANGSLWLRSMHEFAVRHLEGTQDAMFPFWSPDSRSIGFGAEGKLKILNIGGGSPIPLCDAPQIRGGSWGTDGFIVFAPAPLAGIFRVAVTGGIPAPVTKLDAASQDTHRWPYFLPDGRHFLYLAANHSDSVGANTAIYLASVDGKVNRMLVHSLARAEYASGYLLYLREATLVAQPFDPDKLLLSGEPTAIAENVTESRLTWGAVFSASQNGVLAYQSGELAQNELRWYDRDGKKLGTLGSGTYSELRFSPDGTRLAVDFGDPNREVWIFDLRRDVKTRLTFGGTDLGPVWSPDGTRIVFSGGSGRTGAGGGTDILQKKSNGEGQADPLYVANGFRVITDWSPDGRFLLLDNDYPALSQVYVFPLTGERKPYPFAPSGFTERSGHFSPDGHWVAYISRESGKDEVYVAPFPGPGGKWQVSSAGGRMPRWRQDGREIFFVSDDNTLMAAEVEGREKNFDVKKVRPLFHANFAPEVFERLGTYDVAGDGSRFLINTNDQPAPPISLVLHWPADLNKESTH